MIRSHDIYMLTEDLVDRATIFAIDAHGDQVRKYTHEPYITHPLSVANRLMQYGCTDPEILAAAILHDTLEDTDATENDLRELFGERVTRLVVALTDEPPTPGRNRAVRKEATRTRFLLLQGRDAIDACSIKTADLMDNLVSIREHDPKFFKVFREESIALLGRLTCGDFRMKEQLALALEVDPEPYTTRTRLRVDLENQGVKG